MAVEIYLEDEETTTLIYNADELDEWKEQIEKLELEGQKTLASPDKSPVPFPFMNYTMGVVYATLCPRKFPVEKYDKTPIPLRVLSALALARQEGYFNKIEVWIDDQEPDPVLIGYRWPESGSEWSADKYILARWGDEIRPFGELREKALDRLTAAWEITLDEARTTLATIDPRTLAKKEMAERKPTLLLPS